MFVFDGRAGTRGLDPAAGDDKVHVVLHYVVPVVEQPLVHVVRVDQGHVGEGGEEVLRQRVDDIGGGVAGGEIAQDRPVHIAPDVEDLGDLLAVVLELGVVADGRVDRRRFDA